MSIYKHSVTYVSIALLGTMISLCAHGMPQENRTTGICQVVANYKKAEIGGFNIVEPAASARNYFFDFEKRDISTDSAKTILTQLPLHGTLVDEGEGAYSYRPVLGYIGKDSATAVVEIGGYQVKVVYFLQTVNAVVGDNWIEKYCGDKGYQWKVSP